MKLPFSNYKKFIFLVFIVGLLLLGSVFVYNNTKEKALAQEEFVWECGNEIPIGEATDEALDMINKILQNADALLSKAGQEIAAVNDIYELPLPGDCRASNCNTGCVTNTNNVPANTCPPCTTTTVHENPGAPCPPEAGGACVRHIVLGGGPLDHWDWERCNSCTVTQTTCEISPCSGNACPQDKVDEATAKAGQISMLSGQIAGNADVISTERARRDGILAKLEEARGELETCATPASGYEAEEESQLLQTLFSCEEAKFQRILSDAQESCYPTNFFCCRPVQR